MSEFTKSNMFAYNFHKKRQFIFYSVLILIIILGIAIWYILYLKNSDFFIIQGANSFVNHIALNIRDFNALGSFYTTLFGGLFFLPTPIEILFLAALKIAKVAPLTLIGIYMAGMLISYSINYLIGMKLSNTSRRVIGAKKFYKFKGFLNKYGMGAIFLFNITPLPSQPLAAILGVFHYNKAKFYLMFISGQLIKLIAITLAYLYIL
jgi:membrane protein DedA with SNARE-associated domain